MYYTSCPTHLQGLHSSFRSVFWVLLLAQRTRYNNRGCSFRISVSVFYCTTYYMLVHLWRHATSPPVFTSQPTTHQTTCQEEESSNPNPSHATSPPVFTSQPKSPPTTKPPAKRKKAATPTPDPTSFSTGIWVRKLNYKAIGGASLLKITPTKQCVCT